MTAPLTTAQAVKDAAVKIANAEVERRQAQAQKYVPSGWLFAQQEAGRLSARNISVAIKALPVAPDDRDRLLETAAAAYTLRNENERLAAELRDRDEKIRKAARLVAEELVRVVEAGQRTAQRDGGTFHLDAKRLETSILSALTGGK